MLAFSVREALRQAWRRSVRRALSVDLASPATPEAVYWAIEAARVRRGRTCRRGGRARGAMA